MVGNEALGGQWMVGWCLGLVSGAGDSRKVSGCARQKVKREYAAVL